MRDTRNNLKSFHFMSTYNHEYSKFLSSLIVISLFYTSFQLSLGTVKIKASKRYIHSLQDSLASSLDISLIRADTLKTNKQTNKQLNLYIQTVYKTVSLHHLTRAGKS